MTVDEPLIMGSRASRTHPAGRLTEDDAIRHEYACIVSVDDIVIVLQFHLSSVHWGASFFFWRSRVMCQIWAFSSYS